MQLVGLGIKDNSGKEITIGIEGLYDTRELDSILQNNAQWIIYSLTGQMPGGILPTGTANPITGEIGVIPNDISGLTPWMITNSGIPAFKFDNGRLTQIETNIGNVANWGKYNYVVDADDRSKLNLSALGSHPIVNKEAKSFGMYAVKAGEGQQIADKFAAPQGTYAAGDFGDFVGLGGRQGMQTTFVPKNEAELKAAKNAGIIPKDQTLQQAQDKAKKAQQGEVTRGTTVNKEGKVVDQSGKIVGQALTPGGSGTPGAAGSPSFAGTQGVPGVDMPFGGINPLQAFASQTPGEAASFALGSGMLPGFANQNLAAAYRNIYPGLANAYNLALQTGRLTAPVIGQGIAGTDIQAPGVGFAQFTQGGGGNIVQGLQQDLQSIQNVKAKVKAAGGTVAGLTEQELVLYQQIISDPETEYKIRTSLIGLTSPNAATAQARRTMLDRAYSMGELQAPGQLAMTPGGFGTLGAVQAPQYTPPTGAFTPTPPPSVVQPQPSVVQSQSVTPGGTPPIGQPPAGQPPMGQPPMAQPPNTETAAQTAAQAAAMAAATDASLNKMQAQADANRRAGDELAMGTGGGSNLMRELLSTINTVDNVASPAKGGLDMNQPPNRQVEVSDVNETATQINPGSGIKGNPAMLDPTATNIILNNPMGVDQTANDKIFYVDDDGNNVFTFVNKEKISQQAKAQAAATGTPWYDVVYITDPLTGKSLGLKKDSTSPHDDAPYKVMFVGQSGASEIDTSPQPVVQQPLKEMEYSRFQELMGAGGGVQNTNPGGLFPFTTDISDEAPGQAWEQLKKDIGKAKTFKELADLQQSVLNPKAAAEKKELEEMEAFNQFMGQGEGYYGR
tara:strand:- start:6001 stop:8529 length:2529 start_codon:yes stop_codon:yes gene_type:complete